MRLALLDLRHAALRLALACALVALSLSACGQAKPLPWSEIAMPDEMKPGPGLFTGKDGRWVMYGKDYVE